MKIDHRLSTAELDALVARLWDVAEVYADNGDHARAGGISEAIRLIEDARRDAFAAAVKRREARLPKTIFGKQTQP